MRHFTSSRFWRCFEALPADIQALARRNYVLLKQNPAHPRNEQQLLEYLQTKYQRPALMTMDLGTVIAQLSLQPDEEEDRVT